MEVHFRWTVVVLALFAGFEASATSLDFTRSSGKVSVLERDFEGIVLSVTAKRRGRNADVTGNRGGLGVNGGVSHFQSWGREKMVFSFTEAVNLSYLTFDSMTWNDWSGEDKVRYSDSRGISVLLKGSNWRWDLGAEGITSFTLEAKGFLTSTFIADIDVEPVPLPSAAWLFLSAILGGASLARARSSAV
ncbi:hypothetical protein EDC56_0830 [Sinobacterium caligoides]|uniref:Uncharacterized protein n=1 Tax=Sinobacterium caligoides TaxID=933926 RepID=A0A3N2DZN0_9GAMM|nr:hypothetical protein [Sinobacterium caligoides]ROS05300.1 hypothetical protein EDC56_0830 [Sinobacterium caligoides]